MYFCIIMRITSLTPIYNEYLLTAHIPSPSTLQSLLDSAPAGLFAVDRQYCYLAFNRAHAAQMAALCGAEIALGGSVLDCLADAQERAALQAQLERALAGESFTTAGYFGAVGPARLFLEVSYTPLRAADGAITGVSVAASDLTSLKQAEQALQDSEEAYRNIFESAFLGVALIGPQGKYLRANPAFCQMLGYSEAELLQKTFLEVSYEAEKALGANFFHNAQAGLAEAATYQKRFVRKDGALLWCNVMSSALRSASGEFRCLINHVQDITQAKQAEQALLEHQTRLDELVRERTEQVRASELLYRSLFENATSGVSLVSPGGRFLRVNPRLCSILGYPEEELLQLSFNDVTYPADRELGNELVRKVVSGQMVRAQLEKRYLRKDGRQIWVSISFAAVRDTAGQVQYFVSHTQDITEQKQAQQRILDALTFNQTILSSSPIGILIYNAAGDCISANRAAGEILGAAPAALLQQNFRHIHSWQECGLLQAAEQALGQEPPVDLQIHLQSTFGQEVWANATCAALKTGDETHLLLLLEDDSERQHAEQNLLLMNERLIVMVDELEHNHTNADLLRQMSDLLQVSGGLQEALRVVEQFAPRFFAGSSGTLFTAGQKAGLLEAAGSWGGPSGSEPVLEAAGCWALRRSQVYQREAGSRGLACQHIDPNFEGSYLELPLALLGEPVGLLHLEWAAGEALRDSLLNDAQLFAERTSLALANVKLRETLHEQSIRDPLTHAFNRRYMEESLNRELPRARRKHNQLSLVLLDIDHFKKFNDTYGHAAGDLVLVRLTQLLQGLVRIEDIVCRMGGEEFLIILPDTQREAALQRAEDLRKAVMSLQLAYQGLALGTVTISIGVAVYPLHGTVSEELLPKVDAALYRAKNSGRNRVEEAQ